MDFLLIGLMLGVWGSFILYGWVLEDIKGTPWGENAERFKDTDFLILAQSLGNVLVSGSLLLALKEGPITHRLTNGVPQSRWLLTSLAYLGAHKSGIGALDYITYPVQVLVKCCKPIPVLLGEVVIAKEKHPPSKYLSVLLLVVGVVVFVTNKPSKKSTDEHVVFEWSAASAYGLFLVLLALICDGVYGPMQNKIKQEFGGLTAHHNMLSMNLIQGLFSLLKVGLVDGVPYVAVRGFSEVLSFCQRNPAIVPQIGYMTLTMIAGNLFIYELQSRYGSLSVTTTTTLRKLCSILVSVVYFGHKMASIQWLGVFIVVFASPVSKYVLPEKVQTEKDAKKTK